MAAERTKANGIEGDAIERDRVFPPNKSVLSKTILSKTSGFIAEAGFTHSLTPARNCTFGCTYCYVPTMRIQAGLKPDDWRRWGQFTTFKRNAAELLRGELRAEQRIYCSPLVDPYQPAEADERLMPGILQALLVSAPQVFVLQTRGPLILRDLAILRAISLQTVLRVSFSVTTNRESVRRLYEPLCAPIAERLEVIRKLKEAGIETYATLAPLLPCDPEELAAMAIEASGRDLIGDPLHIRGTKKHGATTREGAFRIAQVQGQMEWLNAGFQNDAVERIQKAAREKGREFVTGPKGFARLSEPEDRIAGGRTAGGRHKVCYAVGDPEEVILGQ